MDLDNACELGNVSFGLHHADSIRRESVCQITSPRLQLGFPESVYDSRLGTIRSGILCVTCSRNAKFCPGHFGHIELPIPIVHPLFARFLVNALRCFCMNCMAMLAPPPAGSVSLRKQHQTASEPAFKLSVKRAGKVTTCAQCGYAVSKPVYNASNGSIHINGDRADLVAIRDALLVVAPGQLRSIGLDPEMAHPAHAIMSVLLVTPTRTRPPVCSEASNCDDDLSITYAEIVKICNSLQAADMTTDEAKMTRLTQGLFFRIRALFDNTSCKAKHNNGRALKGIKERLSGKGGIVRQSLMGKRVDHSARTVIGPDPTLPLGVVAIPPSVARTLTKSVRVTDVNKAEMQALVDQGRANFVVCAKDGSRINLAYATRTLATPLCEGDIIVRADTGAQVHVHDRRAVELRPGDTLIRRGLRVLDARVSQKKHFAVSVGDIVERHLQDGDMVLLNRAPTLHLGSMLAHQIVIRPGKTFRFSLGITKSFNADFDGDEQNIHAPVCFESEAELREIASVEGCFFSAQSASTFVSIVQDGVLGMYLLTGDPHITHRAATQLAMTLSPKTLECAVSALASTSPGSLLHGKDLFSFILPSTFTYTHAGVTIAGGKLTSGQICKAHLSGGNSSILYRIGVIYGAKRALQFADDVQFMANAYLAYRGFSINLNDCCISDAARTEIATVINEGTAKAAEVNMSSGYVDEDIKENMVGAALADIKTVGLKVAADAMRSSPNNFVHCVKSGSKGQLFNLAQISGLLGQQQLRGARLVPQLPSRRCAVHASRGEFEDRGFVTGNFYSGLNPMEFFQHAMSGREGVSDTALRTAASGYAQRRIVKFCEDLRAEADGRVTGLGGHIVSLQYGCDGLSGRVLATPDAKHVVDLDAIARSVLA